VVAVERLGWFSADLVVAARYAFTRRMDRADRARWALLWCPFDSEIAIRQGETFRLLLPRRYAKVGTLVAFDEVAENPALADRWRGVEGSS
jgi:hypothetical protein